MKLWHAEPAVIVSLVSAIIALAVSFGLDISAEQTGAIMAVVVLLAGIVTRSQVYPGGEIRRHRSRRPGSVPGDASHVTFSAGSQGSRG